MSSLPTLHTTKSICFSYASPKELSSLFSDFRSMCNDAISVAIQEGPSNRFKLIELAYNRLKNYGLHTHYILSACEVAFSIYRKRKRNQFPRVQNTFLKLDNQSYQLNHLLLRIPSAPRNFIFLTLKGSSYHTSIIDNPGLKKGSVTITQQKVIIAYSKEVDLYQPTGFIGVDINERNATISATDGCEHQFTELGEIVEIKERYKEVRKKIAQSTKGDTRIGRRLLARYGRRERNRTAQRIHKVTKQITDYAEDHKLGIKVEKLKGIRKLYRKGNSQGPLLRGRMNSWVFGETLRQLDYKAKWKGIPFWFVNPAGTSSNCPVCGSHVAPLAGRKLHCPECDIEWDRDVLASRNIMACVVPQARPSKGSDEGERDDDGGTNPGADRGKGRRASKEDCVLLRTKTVP